MKILFVLGAASRIRNFEPTIRLLAERGHTLQLTGRPRKGKLELPKTLQMKGVSIRENPTVRGDEWDSIADTLRGARDYVRYLDPRYASATRLVRRAYEISPTGFVLLCERHPRLKRHWRKLASLLARAEDAIPTAATFEAFVREEQPDLMLVTPLVTFESYQTDYVKVAHRLGIPVAFLPFSWDNLTNKGLIRVLPDCVIVWNEVQKQEAVELHGVSADRVAIAGAARFDEFFAKRPSMDRGEFFASYGLDPTKPLILYLGSSQLTGPNEMELVRQYLESLRAAADPVLRTCGVLVRPHPALKSSWVSVDLSAFGNIGVCLHARRSADQELYDSLWHAHVAVGLNTSAMLEAAIVGRPIQTLVIPGFDEGQVGTIHFRYLVEAFGGLVTVARSFAEHHGQLAGILSSPPACIERSRTFAERFLRPHGIDRPVAPILADAIERAGTIRKQPQRVGRLWHGPLRWGLHTWMRRQPSAGAGRAVVDESVVATSLSLRPVRTALEELRQDTGPIFVGPFLDTIGHELVYWIPFVRWAAHTYDLAPDRLVVISRAGAKPWYGTLAGRFLDARELYRGAEFADWQRRTIPQSQQNPKQAIPHPFDQDILQRAATVMDVSEPQALHPMMLFRILQRLEGDREVHRLREVMRPERFAPAPAAAVNDLAGRDYVAVSLSFTEWLPANASNREWLRELVVRLSREREVVIIDEDIDESLFDAPIPRIQTLKGLMSRAAEHGILEVQTQVLAHARSFYGGLGDLPLLAAFCGTSATAFCSTGERHPLLPAITHAGAHGIWGPVVVHPVDRPYEPKLAAAATRAS